jgi:hypothetical protein
LLEGRRSAPGDEATFRPAHLALLGAMTAAADWAERRLSEREQRQMRIGRRRSIPVRCELSRSRTPRYMEMQTTNGASIEKVKLPGVYRPGVRITRRVSTPRAYAVPRSHVALLNLLSRHRFRTASPDRFRGAALEGYRILSAPPPPEGDVAISDPVVARETIGASLDDYLLFPAGSISGPALGLLLEPESQFGAHRLPELGLTPEEGAFYPILRVN